MLCKFHGLIVVATEISFSDKKGWHWRKSRGVMAVAPGGDVVTCCPQYQIPKEYLLGKLPPISPEEVNESLFRRKVYAVFRGNSISMGRWLEPRDLIGVQDEESNRLCDAREMSGEEKCASEDKELKGTLVWVSSFRGA